MKKFIFIFALIFLLIPTIYVSKGTICFAQFSEHKDFITYTVLSESLATQVSIVSFVDSLNNIHIITTRWTFTGDSTNIENARIDTLSITDWIVGQPDLELNPTALGDVRLFSGAASIADGDDGRHFIIFRKETGDEDSLEFYIDQWGVSYIKSSNTITLSSNGDFYLNDGAGIAFYIQADFARDQILFKPYDATGNHIVIGNDQKDYDIPLQNNPLLAIFGDLDPDISNNHSLRFRHDSSGGVISTGANIGAGSAPDTIDNYIAIYPRGGSAGLKVTGLGNVVLTDTLWILDPAGDDSLAIFDDGDTTRIESDNPIKIGEGSIIIGTNGVVTLNDSMNLGGITLTEDGGCLRTEDFHAHGDGSVAGYYKLHQGTTPSADKEANHSILWTDASEDLYLENAAGTDKKVSVMDTSNSLSVSRSVIPTTSADRATINFGGGGSLIGATADTDALLLANAYYNSGYKYLTNDLASAIKLDDGTITLSTAISGTADNAISWKDVIKLVVGKVLINETSNAKMTEGLTINQGANDNEAFTLKSSDVNHSMSNLTESDTYFSLKKTDADSGGANIRGLSDGDYPGLAFQGIMGTADPTNSNPAIRFQGIKYNGTTGASDMADDETVLAVQNGGNSFSILGNGFVGINTNTPTSALQVVGIVEYADNATAIAGGLTVGAFYRTGDLLKVVH